MQLKSWAGLVLLSTTFQLAALNECRQLQKNQIKYNQCLDERLLISRNNLETWLNHHKEKLKEKSQSRGNPLSENFFQKSQRAFELYRKTHCNWVFVNHQPKSSAATAHKLCEIRVNYQRTQELKKEQ